MDVWHVAPPAVWPWPSTWARVAAEPAAAAGCGGGGGGGREWERGVVEGVGSVGGWEVESGLRSWAEADLLRSTCISISTCISTSISTGLRSWAEAEFRMGREKQKYEDECKEAGDDREKVSDHTYHVEVEVEVAAEVEVEGASGHTYHVEAEAEVAAEVEVEVEGAAILIM